MIKKDFCSLIMAGGKGTRFWPKSTEEKPKQFLKLIGNKTMIRITFERLLRILPIEKIFVVTCEQYKSLVKDELPELPELNIIIEPEGRNTAPCILLASLYIHKLYDNANIAVVPSDHVIENIDEFCDILTVANDHVNSDRNAIVTIGIKPNRPETGYGYIKCSDEKILIESNEIIKVNRFIEKPNLNKANEYLKEGNYLWNAGMFVFNVNYILSEFKVNFNEEYELLSSLDLLDTEELKCRYKLCRAISIDYAIMEKVNSIYVIPGDFGWDDIGSWSALQRYIDKDDSFNHVKGDVVASNSFNNIIYAGDKKVILMDMNDMFCIESDDVIVIGKKEKLDNVYELRNTMVKQG